MMLNTSDASDARLRVWLVCFVGISHWNRHILGSGGNNRSRAVSIHLGSLPSYSVFDSLQLFEELLASWRHALLGCARTAGGIGCVLHSRRCHWSVGHGCLPLGTVGSRRGFLRMSHCVLLCHTCTATMYRITPVCHTSATRYLLFITKWLTWHITIPLWCCCLIWFSISQTQDGLITNSDRWQDW